MSYEPNVEAYQERVIASFREMLDERLQRIEELEAALRKIAQWGVAFPDRQEGYGSRAVVIAREAVPEEPSP